MNKEEIKNAAIDKLPIVYVPTKNLYKILGLGKYKHPEGHWIQVVTFMNSDGDIFNRELHMFEKFKLLES